MSFLLIRGQFLPKRGRPDGDSVRFAPMDSSLFTRLEAQSRHKLRVSTDPSGQVSVQLRYEAIDAMEKDALPDLPQQALANNKRLLGFVEGENEEPSGYILASGIEKNGRPIVFVFAGPPDQEDGATVFIDAPLLKKSVNYQQVEAGLAYPMYYMSLYAELRDEITEAVIRARTAGLGLWQADKSSSGFPFKTRGEVSALPPIFPKLYRRLQKTHSDTIEGFLQELDAQAERVATLSDGRFIRFNDVIERMDADMLRMIYRPEDLVFQEE
jgi:uncharacterized protein (DUF952 family)